MKLIFQTLAISLAEVFTHSPKTRLNSITSSRIIETASRISLTEDMKEVPTFKRE